MDFIRGMLSQRYNIMGATSSLDPIFVAHWADSSRSPESNLQTPSIRLGAFPDKQRGPESHRLAEDQMTTQGVFSPGSSDRITLMRGILARHS